VYFFTVHCSSKVYIVYTSNTVYFISIHCIYILYTVCLHNTVYMDII
jgi:hypothetical protein